MRRCLVAFAVALVAAACGPAVGARPGTVAVVAGENQYGDVVAQVGGPDVTVYSVDSNPNTDPHSYEATPAVAARIAAAGLLVENGAGYDAFVDHLAAASPSSQRRVIDVATLVGAPADLANPHLWYDPTVMGRVAGAVAADLAALQPAHAATFEANASRFVASLQPWQQEIAAFKAAHAGATAAVTEPVADDLLTAMGVDVATPFSFQADVMNGVDPSPQAVAAEEARLRAGGVQVFCYNAQVVDDLTRAVRAAAVAAGVPVVGVYETMPRGFTYQSWMLAETKAVAAAVTSRTSTPTL